MRIRVPSAKGDPKALEEIRRNLAAMPGVSTVDVTEALGTLTIHYDPKKHLDFERHLANETTQQQVTFRQPSAPSSAPKLSDLSHVDEMLAKEAEFLAGHSHTAKAIMEFFDKCDTGVKRVTGNAVDLKVIAPLVLAAGVFFELGIAAATPVWLTLGLFSLNHFVDMHTHPANGDAPDGESQSPPLQPGKTRLG
jgi:hypothetical protein